eukprot:190262-Chlamydomonas_euryale.AAC.1
MLACNAFHAPMNPGWGVFAGTSQLCLTPASLCGRGVGMLMCLWEGPVKQREHGAAFGQREGEQQRERSARRGQAGDWSRKAVRTR